MRAVKRLVVVVILSVLVSANVSAVEETPAARKPAPAAALGAAVLNVVFFPLRLVVTVVFAELGGFTGLMTGGDEQAAHAIWDLVGGRNFLTPEFVAGKEAMRLDSSDPVQVPPPSRREIYTFPFAPDVPSDR